MSAPSQAQAQAERTALAWRRTALGTGTGAVVAARLAAPHLGPAAYALAVVGGVAAVLLFGAARGRYRAARSALEERGPRDAPGPGVAAALLAGLSALIGLTGLLYVVAAGSSGMG